MEIKPNLRLRIEHYRDGKLIRVVDRPTHSFTKWFSRGVINTILRSGTLEMLHEDGYWRIGYLDPRKIAIGDDNTPFALDDYRLKHKLFEVWKYSQDYTETIPPTDIGQQCVFEHQAVFRFTDTYNIWELGFFSETNYGGWLISRDVLDSAITVINGDTLVVKYKGVVA
jgi:hypothetical protein